MIAGILNLTGNLIGAANPILSLAQDAVGLVENANEASNSNNSSGAKRAARQGFIHNSVNIGVPAAAAVVGGIASSNVAGGIPAAVVAQGMVKSSGVGNLMGELFQPLLIPFANMLSFLKKKVKEHVGLDLNKLIGTGVNVAKPMLNMGGAISSTVANAKTSAPAPHPLEDLLGLFNLFTSNIPQNGQTNLASITKLAMSLLGGLTDLLVSMNDPRARPIVHSATQKSAQAKQPDLTNTALNAFTTGIKMLFG